MIRRIITAIVLGCVLLAATSCRHAKVTNPIANVDSKQPDKVLFDRAMKEMKGAKYAVARTLLETLINTYPDSEYVARAKLSLGDSWYAEGGTAAMTQAETEYTDFITFFPNTPEAAEAQLKIGNIHYRQMEKFDRDYAHVLRAEDAYKKLLETYPNSPLVPQAKQKLREVQEVLAERQNNIARFYFLRDNLAAAQARYSSLVDSYPLYSQIDEALFTLATIFQKQALSVSTLKIPEAIKEKLIAEYEKKAIEYYSRIITRYPAKGRVGDARSRLADMKAPIPTPTPEAIAQSKAEEDSRGDVSRFRSVLDTFKRHPDVSKTTKTGEPSMTAEVEGSAPEIVQHLTNELNGGTAPSNKLGTEVVGGAPGTAPASNQAAPGTKPSNAPPPAPLRTNEIDTSAPATAGPQAAAQQAPDSSNQKDSSSQKKKKKGIRKLIPF